ncbi:MAG TPA: hypothetical protein VFC78_24350 [Tepidisphaeraceae bacterium]|nr:hypothetical protein [Tepidisphaeraceae bacterium]
MITVRQIERHWQLRSYKRLAEELIAARTEASFELEVADRPSFAAALALIRLDELCQSHLPLYGKLVRAVLSAQDRDGGWADPVCTALCLRALLLGNGDGESITRGFTYLANLQKEEGAWPAGPLRRMPADPVGSAFILYQLADSPRFREAVRLGDAIAWFDANAAVQGNACRRLWEWVSLRCRPAVAPPPRLPSLFAA